MTPLINVAFAIVYCVVNGEAGPSALRLQPPGGEKPRGCVQGAEVMGGVFADLPPCPPWVDDKERCRIGDTILSRSQCLDIMTEKEYLALSRSRPLTMSLPPSAPRPINILVSPPGWPSGGSPPGGWAQSHPPSPPGSHFGPPGISSDNMMKDSDILPPGQRSSLWSSRRPSLGSMSGSPPASPPGSNVPSQIVRAIQRRNWRRRAPKTWTRRRSSNRRSRKQNRDKRGRSLRRRSRKARRQRGLSAPPGTHKL